MSLCGHRDCTASVGGKRCDPACLSQISTRRAEFSSNLPYSNQDRAVQAGPRTAEWSSRMWYCDTARWLSAYARGTDIRCPVLTSAMLLGRRGCTERVILYRREWPARSTPPYFPTRTQLCDAATILWYAIPRTERAKCVFNAAHVLKMPCRRGGADRSRQELASCCTLPPRRGEEVLGA
eukprot:2687244-Rhodomonas_salina.3